MDDDRKLKVSAATGGLVQVMLNEATYDEILPPYQLRRQSMMYCIGTWPEDAELPPLPDGLSPGPDRLGVIGIFNAREGRGPSPCKLFFAGIVVRETYAQDGTEAVYTFHGLVEGKNSYRLSRFINGNYVPGHVLLSQEGDLWHGGADLGEGGQIRLTLRAQDVPAVLDGGTNYYIGQVGGAISGFTVAYSILHKPADLVDLSYSGPDDHPLAVLRRFRPDTVRFVIPDMSMTYGVPFPLELATPEVASTMASQHERDSAATSALDILARIGRALAIVDDRGRILYTNGEAETILGSLEGGSPRRLSVGSEGALPGSPTQTREGRVSLKRADGTLVIARVLPIGLRLSARPALMVLLDDPAASGPTDPAALLRLYGLTPAEAKLAAIVGKGHSPAEAAMQTGITRESARTVLKVVFGKLDLQRQSQLARLVARLETV